MDSVTPEQVFLGCVREQPGQAIVGWEKERGREGEELEKAQAIKLVVSALAPVSRFLLRVSADFPQ